MLLPDYKCKVCGKMMKFKQTFRDLSREYQCKCGETKVVKAMELCLDCASVTCPRVGLRGDEKTPEIKND